MTTSSTTLQTPFGELTVETESIDVTSSLPRPDPAWSYTDREGHEHHYVPDRLGPEHYPTLATVVDRTYWCPDCQDDHQDTHLECVQCGEHITPATLPPTGEREHVDGRTSATLNGRPLTRERYEEITDALQRTVYVPSGMVTDLPGTGVRVFHQEGHNIPIIPMADGTIVVGETCRLQLSTDSGDLITPRAEADEQAVVLRWEL